MTAPTRKRRKAAPITDAATNPVTTPAHQLSLRLTPAEHDRVTRCAADAEFHGGATVTAPTVLRKALYVYLAAYEREAR